MTGRKTRISDWLIDRADGAEHNVEKLLTIAASLMRHSEERGDEQGAAFEEFRRAAVLEDRIRQRTRDLEATLQRLNKANSIAERARRDLSQAIEAIEEGFALFDADDLMVLCNSRFCRDFTDVRPKLVPGMSFTRYVEKIGRSRDLLRDKGQSPADWTARRLKRHPQRQVFNVGLVGDRWI